MYYIKFRHEHPVNPENPLILIHPANPIILKILILTVAIILFLFHASTLHALTPVVIDDNTESVSLGRYMDILEDPTGRLTIDDVTKPEMNDKWFRSKWDVPNFGYTDSAYWIKFQFSNNSADALYYFEIAYPLLDLIDLYIPNDNNYTKSSFGDSFPHNHRRIFYRNILIPLNLISHKYYYLRIKTSSAMSFPLKIINTSILPKIFQNEYITYGLYYGILIVMILYNFFVYLSIRDKSYLFYIFYIINYLFFSFSLNGFSYQYLWQNIPWWNNRCIVFFIFLLNITIPLFSRSFLDLKNNLNIVDRLLIFLIVAGIIGTVASLFFPYNIMIEVANLIGTIAILLIIICSIICYYKGFKPARFFILAWVTFCIGIALLGLQNLGFLPFNYLTQNAHQIGSAIEVTLLSFALADRINIMKKEKEDAQNDALRIQKEATETLEQKVTERTEELAHANEKLRDLDRAKTDFFANVSHELRTPLTLILAPVDGALKGNPLDRESLESIERNGRNLLSLINDLLDVSRITAGRMKLRVTESDIRELAKQCSAEMESTAKLKGLSICCNISDNSPPVYVDGEKILHIMSNFFSNSFKFTEPGGKIEVSVFMEGDHAVIKFSDSGCGIPADKITAIFDRFSQADTSTTRRHEGTGIGLSIVKDFVGLHGGTVSVESRHIDEFPGNHGTVFTVKIPSGKEHFEGRNDVIFKDRDAKTESMSLPHIRGLEINTGQGNAAVHISGNEEIPAILVVEDNADLRRLLVNMLSGTYSVYQAANGKEAVDVLNANDDMDLVLSDIMMPVMDGHELLKWVRADERFAGLPVVFLTARADSFMKLEGLDLGAIDYVTKPFSSDELKLRIRNQMELRRLRNSLKRSCENLLAKLKAVNARPVTEENVPKFESICGFIREHCAEELTRDDLAAAVGLNPDTFSRMFNQFTGKTLYDYINEHRVNEAKKKLIETTDTVTRICMDTGFDSIRTFNRVFRKLTGMSPIEFRERIRIEQDLQDLNN